MRHHQEEEQAKNVVFRLNFRCIADHYCIIILRLLESCVIMINLINYIFIL